jgi:hypothetical protein
MSLSQVYSLDFTLQPNQNPLSDGGNWTVLQNSPLQILSAACTVVAGPGSGCESLTGTALNPDQAVEFTVGAIHSSEDITAYIRSSIGLNQGQGFRLLLGSNGHYSVLDAQANQLAGGTIIISGSSGTPSSGDVWRLEAIGTTVNLYKNASLLGTAISSSLVVSTQAVLQIDSSTPGNTTITKFVAYTDTSGHVISGNCGLCFGEISYSGTASGSVLADSNGNYRITNLSNGSYTITPSRWGNWSFTPSSQSVTVSSADVSGVNFTASPAGGPGIVQWDDLGGSSGNSEDSTFFESDFGMPNVTAGDALVVSLGIDAGVTVTSVTDNYGNTYHQVPGAYVSDSTSGRASDVWWAANVAQVNDPPTTLVVTVNLSGNSTNWGWTIYQVRGINNAAPSSITQVISNTSSPFNGSSLDGGSGAFYLSNAVNQLGSEAVPSVASPWMIPITPGIAGDGGNTFNFQAGQGTAGYAGTGTQQAVFTPSGSFEGVVSNVVFVQPSGHTVSGNAGVADAVVNYSGISSGSVTADGSGNYSITGLADGNYAITPTLTDTVFTPASRNVTVSGANVSGVNFQAAQTHGWSPVDCRSYATFPNFGVVQLDGSVHYTGQTSCNEDIPTPDAREAGAPVDSRVENPENSRVDPADV